MKYSWALCQTFHVLTVDLEAMHCSDLMMAVFELDIVHVIGRAAKAELLKVRMSFKIYSKVCVVELAKA